MLYIIMFINKRNNVIFSSLAPTPTYNLPHIIFVRVLIFARMNFFFEGNKNEYVLEKEALKRKLKNK